ncbi:MULTISPECIES: GNAT family N-acetyltransferase [Bacillaceae]|uniref:GNAT family N-acetyltransferase n=1 Tax=Bacillaceae TaxID=186817 RepID=UPI002FFFAEDD
MQALIRKGTKEDLNRLRDFLLKAKLGTDGLSEDTIGSFLLLENGKGELVGSLGMEVFERVGLLRSLVVSSGWAEKEILVLFDQMVQLAKERGMESLFLATNKPMAVAFFELMGFQQIRRESLPEELLLSNHIRHVFNVDNSLFFKFTL